MSVDPKQSRAVFQKLERDLVKLSSKPQAESVHRFRTGTRRLQMLLGELSPKLDRSEKKLLKLLGRIRKRAGNVRDLDVQLAALRGFKVPREPRRKTQLVDNLIELRRQQEKKLRKVVDKETIREIRKRLHRAAKRFRAETARDPLALAKSMADRLDRAHQPLTEAVLHQYRIMTKRARYAAEFALTSNESKQFIAQIRAIQDAVGDWHDWLILSQTARENLGDVHESPLVAELQNVTGAKFRHATAVLSRKRDQPQAATEPTPRVPLPAPVPPKRDAASAA